MTLSITLSDTFLDLKLGLGNTSTCGRGSQSAVPPNRKSRRPCTHGAFLSLKVHTSPTTSSPPATPSVPYQRRTTRILCPLPLITASTCPKLTFPVAQSAGQGQMKGKMRETRSGRGHALHANTIHTHHHRAPGILCLTSPCHCPTSRLCLPSCSMPHTSTACRVSEPSASTKSLRDNRTAPRMSEYPCTSSAHLKKSEPLPPCYSSKEHRTRAATSSHLAHSRGTRDGRTPNPIWFSPSASPTSRRVARPSSASPASGWAGTSSSLKSSSSHSGTSTTLERSSRPTLKFWATSSDTLRCTPSSRRLQRRWHATMGRRSDCRSMTTSVSSSA